MNSMQILVSLLPKSLTDPDIDPVFFPEPASLSDTKQTNRAHLIPYNKSNPITLFSFKTDTMKIHTKA